MRFERVRITRDTNTVHNTAFPPWEIPVLEAVFDDGNVVRTGDFVDVDREYPEPLAEYQRLQSAYGIDTEQKAHFVSLVYGNAGAGVRSLKKAIEAAQEEDAEAKPKPVKAGRKARATAEPLLS